MSAVRRRKASSTTAKQNKASLRLPKQKPLPQGKSRIDFLPDDILLHIYKYKHQLEFQETLKRIAKLKVALDHEIVETKIPIKKLLQKATDRKQIYINVAPFNHDCVNGEGYTNDKHVKQEFNANKVQFHQGMYNLCQVEIKFNDKINILVIDVLYIVYQLGLTQRVGTTLVDIISDDIHHKTSMIKFKLC